MMNANQIGEKIVVLRKERNLSQASLAKELSISSQAVGKWERGESLPDILMLNRISSFFKVSLNYFSDENYAKDFEENVSVAQTTDVSIAKKKWDISKLSLVDSDFSGLKNLNEKLSSANIKSCKFNKANLEGIGLNKNYIDDCDFAEVEFKNASMYGTFIKNTSFDLAQFQNSKIIKTALTNCTFNQSNFNDSTFQNSYLTKCDLINAFMNSAQFKNTGFHEVKISSYLQNTSFENCTFYKVEFENMKITNSFFKNNRKMKNIKFTNCSADKISIAFLKNNGVDVSDIKEV